MSDERRRRQARRRGQRRRVAPLLPVVSLLALLAGLVSAFGAAGGVASAAPARQASDAYVEIHVAGCPPGYDGNDYYNDCHGNGMAGVTVTLTSTSDSAGINQTKTTTVPATPGPGIVHFANVPRTEYRVVVEVPADTNNFYSYCSIADGDTQVPVSPNDQNDGTFTVPAGQSVVCDWYVIPDAQAPATKTPATTTPAAQQRQASTQAAKPSITVNAWTCPTGEATDATYATLQADCTTRDPENVLTLINSKGETVTKAPNGATSVWGDLDGGNYVISGSIGGDVATPVLYCTADNGNPYQKAFDNELQSTFQDVTTEQIVCDWYTIPADLKGQTGSVTVHLGVCPSDYTGTDFYGDCHDNGVKGQVFTLTGSNGNATNATTTRPGDKGPGIAQFNDLDPDTYTLTGGVPGEFATLKQVYCTNQAADGKPRIDVQMDNGAATFAVGGGQAILCDWFMVAENLSGNTPTPVPTKTPALTPTPKPTKAPAKASILVTMYQCPQASSSAQYAGASYGDLQADCTDPLNDVSLSLQGEGGPPITAKTGASGEGALRFYDLNPATYTLSADLSGSPDSYMFCTIKGGDTYQKDIQNNATVYQDLETEQITCDWYVVPITPATQPAQQTPAPQQTVQPQQPVGPSGSITVREFLCGKDASQIKDWERQCKAGQSGSAYTLTSSDKAITKTGTPDSTGVLVFNGLPDGFYALKQGTGQWCHATADRVDSKSRVIVQDGKNTDVFLYQCTAVKELPSTGSGAAARIAPLDGGNGTLPAATWLALLATALLGAGWVVWRRAAR